jgi:hypothetical protein
MSKGVKRLRLDVMIDLEPNNNSTISLKSISNIKYLCLSKLKNTTTDDVYHMPELPDCLESFEFDAKNSDVKKIIMNNLPSGLKELTIINKDILQLDNLPFGLEILKLNCVNGYNYFTTRQGVLDSVKAKIKLPFGCRLYINGSLVITD